MSMKMETTGLQPCPVLLLTFVSQQLIGEHGAEDSDENADDGDAKEDPQADVEDSVNI